MFLAMAGIMLVLAALQHIPFISNGGLSGMWNLWKRGEANGLGEDWEGIQPALKVSFYLEVLSLFLALLFTVIGLISHFTG